MSITSVIAMLGDLERLTSSTAVDALVRFRRSAQRFELDTYYGDALPTELMGRGRRGFRTADAAAKLDRAGEHTRPEITAVIRLYRRRAWG